MKHVFLHKQNWLIRLWKWSFFIFGLLIMSLGIALMIEAHLGSAPWDVLHIGLYKHFGLTVGTWSVIVGCLIITTTSLLRRCFPETGALLNMVLVGAFIDLFLHFLAAPDSWAGKTGFLLIGILINGIGISVYISGDKGAGPRDTLMLYLTEKTGWKVSHIRRMMELCVLIAGWLMGGPVSAGTVLFGLTIGTLVGWFLPFFRKVMQTLVERGADSEDFYKRSLRVDHHDGAGEKAR
ncbi:YczE/YyaS/YitT family protein [Tuberibacillus sp. Marseille-P3662]|uniref:YczE/YyaS/YitT family protein n=1 Tax=Tuberibacillus sp. Marseille-P3662 TaxID=1965358 RepID=UPI0020CB55D8|nr:YitT family protein [Tuberibacillus sp. Marseille-P3662]